MSIYLLCHIIMQFNQFLWFLELPRASDSVCANFRANQFPCPLISVSVDCCFWSFPCPSISASVDHRVRQLLEALGRLKKAQRRSLEVLKKSIRASEWSPRDLERLLGN